MELLSMIKNGVPAREVYVHAVSYIRDKKPELEKYFVKNIGFGVSLVFLDVELFDSFVDGG